MGHNIHVQLKEKARDFECFALAMDESNDVQDTHKTQLLIFIRGVNSFFEVSEELAALQSLTDTTTGEDIFSQVRQTMEELDLDSMIGASKGLAGLIKSDEVPPQIHCLIHQQPLCCKVLKLESVMKVVVSCINFIRANRLTELESAHGDVLYLVLVLKTTPT